MASRKIHSRTSRAGSARNGSLRRGRSGVFVPPRYTLELSFCMALFGKNQGKNHSDSDESPPSMANQTNAVQDQVNLVGEGTVFEGTIDAGSDVRASGRIIGTLDVDGKAMIAEGGSVEGEIIATNADVAGKVQGEIHVDERLVLKSTARVEGKLDTDRLVVEEGAQFSGECEMGTPIETDGSASSTSPERSGFGTSVGSVSDNDTSSEAPAGISAEDETESA